MDTLGNEAGNPHAQRPIVSRAVALIDTGSVVTQVPNRTWTQAMRRLLQDSAIEGTSPNFDR